VRIHIDKADSLHSCAAIHFAVRGSDRAQAKGKKKKERGAGTAPPFPRSQISRPFLSFFVCVQYSTVLVLEQCALPSGFERKVKKVLVAQPTVTWPIGFAYP